MKRHLPTAIAFVITLVCLHCTPRAQSGAEALLTRKAQCALANWQLPPAELAMKCAIQDGDLHNYIDLVSVQRQQIQAAQLAGCGDKR